jgi:hypothetical protein
LLELTSLAHILGLILLDIRTNLILVHLSIYVQPIQATQQDDHQSMVASQDVRETKRTNVATQALAFCDAPISF